MKTLIVEDDLSSRLLLQKILSPYGECHIAVNGREAVTAFGMAKAEKKPYDLICLDIMMPEMNGQEVLLEIRKIEKTEGTLVGNGVKIFMTTALDDKESVITAFREWCDAYLIKPISKAKLLEYCKSFGLIR